MIASRVPGKREARKPIRTASYPPTFTPEHCGGTTCLHDHAGDATPTLGWFRPLLGRLTGAAS